ncbi:MAG: hypothetical protein J6V99_07640 [Neisseriaceae bacterium]|nr:hypothetical protein [Neisseriaceae bacterium]
MLIKAFSGCLNNNFSGSLKDIFNKIGNLKIVSGCHSGYKRQPESF